MKTAMSALGSAHAKRHTAMSTTSMRNEDDDEGEAGAKPGEVEGKDIDPDAMAFIHAKRKVDDLQRAKKQEKRIH